MFRMPKIVSIMQLYQYFQYDRLVSSSLICPAEGVPVDMRGWLQSQMMISPLTVAEVDHDYVYDPCHLLINDATLVRDLLTCSNPDLESAWARVDVDNGIKGLLHTPDWSLQRKMVGEIPPDTAICHHAKPLTYCGTVGVLGTPKQFSFSMNACSPAAAWEKVRLRLEIQGFSPANLLLHDIGLGATSFHDLTTRDIEETDDCADPETDSAWKSLVDHEDSFKSSLLELGAVDDPDFSSEIPFLLRKLMVDYGWVEREQQIDYQRLARSVRNAWRTEDSIKAHPPRRQLAEEGFFGPLGEQITESSEMFFFTSEERQVLEVPPTMRFLVTRNIPANAELTLRDQQAWCDFYLAKIA